MAAPLPIDRFVPAEPVPVVSGDPVDRPMGKWLAETPDRPDTVLIGIPFDGATVVPARKGSAGGPAALRQCLGDLNCYSIPLDVDISDKLSGRDLGNVRIDDGMSVQEVHETVSATLSTVVPEVPLTVTMGGDDSLTFAACRGLCRATDGQVGVVGFDAHLDMRYLYDYETASGSSYRRIMDELEGQVRPRNIAHIGANGWFAAREYAQYAKDQGVGLVTADEVFERGIEDVMTEAIARASDGTDAIYVNFDVDVLDQHYAPGKVMRNPGGMNGRDAYAAARMLGREPKLRLFALNEVNSKRDISSITALVGASVIAYVWGGRALSA